MAAVASSCAWLYAPVRMIWASVELGQLREAAHDTKGACEAYRRVVDRWGHVAKSTSAKLARRRMAALRCPGPEE